MRSYISQHVTARILALTAALLVASGCAQQPQPSTVAQIEQTVSDAGQIEYRIEGEPVDLPPMPQDHLELDAALAETLRHDPQLQAALARVHAALADARQARLLPNPILSVVFRWPEAGGKPVIEAALSAELLRLLQRPSQISAADNRLRAAASEALAVALDLVAQVQERYATVQAIDAELVNLEQRLDLVNRLLSVARSRVEAGESSRLDVLTLDSERLGIETEGLERQAERRDERLALARLLGRPSDAADWKLAPWQPPPPLEPDERYWIEASLRNRPEVQARRWELAALADQAAEARWAAFDGAEIGVDAERDEGIWSVGPGVSMPLPLLDWGQARRERAKAELVEARHMLVQAQRQVIEDVRRALASLSEARGSLDKVRIELVPLLERRQEQASAAYRVGETDITAVLLAEQELQRARSRAIALQRRVAMAQAKLVRAAGSPTIKPGV